MTDRELKAFLEALQEERLEETAAESTPQIAQPAAMPETPVPKQTKSPDVPREKAAAVTEKTRRYEVLVGILLLILSCVGLFTLVQTGLTYGLQLRGKSDIRSRIEERILPLVLMDVVPFGTPAELSDTEFLTAAIWTMITDGSLRDYEETNGFCYVPAATVTAVGNRCFGTVRSPEYGTIGFTDTVRFYYDSEDDRYLIPVHPAYYGSVPEITNIAENQDSYIVTVACRTDVPAWQKEKGDVQRTLEFLMRQADGQWTIAALRLGQ